MVFGWGKKKIEKSPEEIPRQKEIELSDVLKINQDLLSLRKNQTLSEIKSLRNQTFPLIKELANIGKTLENDNLKVEEIDKHLRIIVVRGKKQVIEVIKKDSTELPEVSSFEDIFTLENSLNQKLKRIGDVLGRQTRVIHIFAKKYAEKLKEILEEMNSNHSEVKTLIKNFQDTNTASSEITELFDRVKVLENEIVLKKTKIIECQKNIDSYQENLKTSQDSIDKIKSSENYLDFINLTKKLSSFTEKEIKLKDEVETQFTKISRALSRYEYASALDKDQKVLLTQLINEPIMAMNSSNMDSIIVIFENVKKGIVSGSISVKDKEKSISNITDTEELLEDFIKKNNVLKEQKNGIQNQISLFDKSELSSLQKKLEQIQDNKHENDIKINTMKNEINENQKNIPELITKIEAKLKRFSKTDYRIVHQTQN